MALLLTPAKWVVDLLPRRARAADSYYERLPGAAAGPSKERGSQGVLVRVCHILLVRRRARTFFVVLGTLVGVAVAVFLYILTIPLPPLYSRFHGAELDLRQHDSSLPFPEGKHGKFLWVANHASSKSGARPAYNRAVY